MTSGRIRTGDAVQLHIVRDTNFVKDACDGIMNTVTMNPSQCASSEIEGLCSLCDVEDSLLQWYALIYGLRMSTIVDCMSTSTSSVPARPLTNTPNHRNSKSGF